MNIRIRTIKFISLILFIVFSIFVIKNLGYPGLMSPMELRESLSNYGSVAPFIFILLYIFLTLFLFPGTVLTIAAGVLFGTILGTLYTIIGATIGASLLFLISRYLGRSFISEVIENKYKKIKDYENKLEKQGFKVVVFLRLVPLFPFSILNFSLGLTKVKFKDYFLGTMLGIIPGSFALAYFGDSITELNYTSIIISSLLFILLIFSPKIYKYFKKRFEK
jgi:uncharacterized membrane protein YdjX (TVP38/TMEM64 family)